MSRQLCRVSGTELVKIMSFGDQPLGNGFLKESDFADEYFFPMEIGFSETSKMLQLVEQPSPEKMFHEQYAFYSGTSQHMTRHFRDFYADVMASGFLSQSDPFVIELGCNDGILLKNFAADKIRHLGIEPSQNVAAVANQSGVVTISEFFNQELADTIARKHGQADVFLAANVMCHIPDIVSVVKGIKTILKPTGIVMFEDPYLGDVIEKTSYDQIYDEHAFLFSAHSVQYLFGLYGLELIDAVPQKTHGGSMRYIVAHKNAKPIAPFVDSLLEQESRRGLDKLDTFFKFKSSVEKSKDDLLNLLRELRSSGRRIVGYGATSKSTTILNYCGIGPSLIEFISDTTPIKQGKFTPGMHIPVKPYEAFTGRYPDYALLFAWNHAEEIMAKESQFMEAGGKWITHVPHVGIL